MPAFGEQPEPAQDAGAVRLRSAPRRRQRAPGSRSVTVRRGRRIALAAACFCPGRERRRVRRVEEAQAPRPQIAPPHVSQQHEAGRTRRKGRAPQARQRARRRRGLPGGDRRVHEGLRAAERSGRAVQPRRVLPPRRRRRPRDRRLPRVPREGSERAQPRRHRSEDRRAGGARAGRSRRRHRRAAPVAKPPPPPRRREGATAAVEAAAVAKAPPPPVAKAPPPPAEPPPGPPATPEPPPPPHRRRRRAAAPETKPEPAVAVRRAAPPADAARTGGSRPWVWVALSVLAVGAGVGGLPGVSPAGPAAARIRRWATTGSERAALVSPHATPGPGRGRRRAWRRRPASATIRSCWSRWRAISTLMPAQLSVDGDGGRLDPACFWSRPRRPRFRSHQLHCGAGSEYHRSRDDRDRRARCGGYVLASGTTTQTHINTGGQTIIAVTLDAPVPP